MMKFPILQFCDFKMRNTTEDKRVQYALTQQKDICMLIKIFKKLARNIN